MSFGFNVTVGTTDLRLDDQYRNLSYLGALDLSITGVGYQVIDLSVYASHTLVACARHEGMALAFLGYELDAQNRRSAIRVHAFNVGDLKLELYSETSEISISGFGVAIYNEHGVQTFHSNNRYMDVFDYVNLTTNDASIMDGYYVLSNPSSPTHEYWFNDNDSWIYCTHSISVAQHTGNTLSQTTERLHNNARVKFVTRPIGGAVRVDLGDESYAPSDRLGIDNATVLVKSKRT